MKWVQFTVTTVFLSVSSRAAKQTFIYTKMSTYLNYVFTIVLSNYILSLGDKGELLSMNDTKFIALELEASTAVSGDGTNEPVLWQQMCPDRYKQSQLWVLQADPRGLSKGKEPSGTCVADPSLPLYLQRQTLMHSFISRRPIFTKRAIPIS